VSTSMKKETVSIIVATFGPDKEFWDGLAKRALGSVENQTVRPTEVHRVHVPEPNSLHVARNRGASMSESDLLCFLDADDMLHPNYIESMLECEGDVRYPSVERFYTETKHKDPPQLVKPGKSLLNYSHIVIGAAVKRQLFIDVGGFEDWECWEDWHFWLKCWVNGADIKPCKQAIYQSFVRNNSRSRTGKLSVVVPIRASIEPLAIARGLIPADWH
jgi:glycosyltransferase involved in cell wall biosynthesis